MLDLFNIAKPQGCDIQTFYGVGGTTRYSWNKPRGVSHVYMLLLGAGAPGDGTTGGGSGSITRWYGAAQNVPDSLLVQFTVTNTSILLRRDGPATTTLIEAASGSGTNGGAASTGGSGFVASGFFQSVAGQGGSSSGSTASSTTFLNGGGNGAATSNYGYTCTSAGGSTGPGFFQMQPIIVGVGGTLTYKGGIGCGGGVNGTGGPGMVLIASW